MNENQSSKNLSRFEEFVNLKAGLIGEAMILIFGDVAFETRERLYIEKLISETASAYAKVFRVEYPNDTVPEEVQKGMRLRVRATAVRPEAVDRASLEEIIGQYIDIQVWDYLYNHYGIVS